MCLGGSNGEPPPPPKILRCFVYKMDKQCLSQATAGIKRKLSDVGDSLSGWQQLQEPSSQAACAGGGGGNSIPLQPTKKGAVTPAATPSAVVGDVQCDSGSLERYCFDGDWFRDINLDSSPLVIDFDDRDQIHNAIHSEKKRSFSSTTNDKCLSPLLPTILPRRNGKGSEDRGTFFFWMVIILYRSAMNFRPSNRFWSLYLNIFKSVGQEFVDKHFFGTPDIWELRKTIISKLHSPRE